MSHLIGCCTVQPSRDVTKKARELGSTVMRERLSGSCTHRNKERKRNSSQGTLLKPNCKFAALTGSAFQGRELFCSKSIRQPENIYGSKLGSLGGCIRSLASGQV